MKTFLLILILLLVTCSSRLFAQETKLTIDLSRYFQKPKVSLSGPNFNEVLTYDSSRKSVISLSLKEAAYFTLSIDLSANTLYLEPGKDLMISVVPNEKGEFIAIHLDLRFEGENADINTYLNTCKLGSMEDKDFLLDERTYLRKIEQLLKQNKKTIHKYKLNKQFEEKELMRARYQVLEGVTSYPIQHFWEGGNKVSVIFKGEETPIVKEYIARQLIDDEKAWQVSAYRKYVKSAVAMLAFTDFGASWESIIQERLRVLTQYFKSPRILEDMVQNMALVYVESTRGDSLMGFQTAYDKYVSKPEYRQELEKVYAMWNKLKKGQHVVSSGAVYEDVEGNTVSLDDLKGKYIYIDVWATWCGPCRAEIPFLKKLEEEFHGKNIHFVSISMDERKRNWIKMVEQEKLGGIQLWGGPSAQIAIDYKIKGIPRFILLDREGKVIDNNMSRPSEAVTKKVLEELEGI